MLLYVFKDGTCRNVEDNPSTADILAVVSGILSIFKATPQGFCVLEIKNGKFHCTMIKKAVALACSAGKIQGV